MARTATIAKKNLAVNFGFSSSSFLGQNRNSSRRVASSARIFGKIQIRLPSKIHDAPNIRALTVNVTHMNTLRYRRQKGTYIIYNLRPDQSQSHTRRFYRFITRSKHLLKRVSSLANTFSHLSLYIAMIYARGGKMGKLG